MAGARPYLPHAVLCALPFDIERIWFEATDLSHRAKPMLWQYGDAIIDAHTGRRFWLNSGWMFELYPRV